jgi:hypothetical protein
LGFLRTQEFQIPSFDFGGAPTPSSSSSSSKFEFEFDFEYQAPTTTYKTNTATIIRRRKPKHVRRKYVLDGSKKNLLDMMASHANDARQTAKHHPQDRIHHRALTA